ncbi:MAG: hypothetical protein JNN15_19495, partial [Blastocatellia bacterium]|nr:hypothetical protein [Blastocatellia bacterium]
MPKHSPVDVVILTILLEEYDAVLKKIENPQPPQLETNLYAWEVGKIGAYTVAVGMIGRAGNTNSSQATSDAIDCFDPQYVFLVGIAGGLREVEKGGVVIADIIYGYEYGKIEKIFTPRVNFTYRTDLGLLNMAT